MRVEECASMKDVPNLLSSADGKHPIYMGDSLDLHPAIEIFKGALFNVSEALPGRMELLQQTALALLTRRHQLLISRAGTGKSLYGENVFGQFEGELFKAQFTQGTRLETVLGGLDLQLFNQGKLWHNTRNSLISADFAYLDEFMNSNDLVLEAILGVLNERKFAEGEQQEDARLHTALAMTNHLKYSVIAEPILDRFMFKASIDPRGDTLDDIMIDLAYAQHHGRPMPVAHPLPLSVLQHMSDIVQGQDESQSITASHSMLFLKNDLIERYMTLAGHRAQSPDARDKHDAQRSSDDIYVSPRTKAACRDVLNASALLHHRFEVEKTDLNALRFVLTTIAGNDRTASPQHDIFNEALNATLAAYTDEDLQQVDELTTIAQNFHWFATGMLVEAHATHGPIVRLFLALMGKSSWNEVGYDTFVDALRGRRLLNPRVNALREEILGDILSHAQDEQAQVHAHA